MVLGWWLTLQPRNDRKWLASNAEIAWAEMAGDTVTLHNVRNFDQRAGNTDPAPRWETRIVDLAKLTGADLFHQPMGITANGAPDCQLPVR